MSQAGKLTQSERRHIEKIIAKTKNKNTKFAQDSIPFQRMYQDGLCRVTDNFYSKTIQFNDINFQLSQNEDKTAIFNGWCDFLNYFDSSVRLQLSFVNMSANKDNSSQISIPLRGDENDSIREEYTQMLRNQLSKGNNGLVKRKYLTFGIESDSLKSAKTKLERIETDILNNFKKLGVTSEVLNGYERLELMSKLYFEDEEKSP